MSRWVLTDPATSETWTMPINPNAMTSPFPSKNLSHAYGVLRGSERAQSFLHPPALVQWEWRGVIRSQEHHDTYLHWAAKSSEVHVTDHLGRTWEVLITAFEPEDRKPTARTEWRMRYAVRAVITRRVS